MKVPFIDYKTWYQIEKCELDKIVLKCFNEGELLLRDGVKNFQNNFSNYVGTKYAIGTSNCTDALRIALSASNIGPGDEVITSAHTFAASVASICQVGATPVLADIKEYDHLIDVDSIIKLITSKTKAIMPISLNGRVADLDLILEISEKYNLMIIEDSAQGLGALLNGKMAGSFGISGCFSFYPAKTLGALGDAGAITTNSEEIYQKALCLRNHNRSSEGNIDSWGYNNRIDNVQASVLDYRLTQLELYIKRRREIAKLYFEGLNNVKQIQLPPNDRNETQNIDSFQNFEINAENRNGLVDYLMNNNIEIILPWGGYAIHHHSAFDGKKDHLTVTDKIFDSILMLPIHYTLSDEQVEFVIYKVKGFYK